MSIKMKVLTNWQGKKFDVGQAVTDAEVPVGVQKRWVDGGLADQTNDVGSKADKETYEGWNVAELKEEAKSINIEGFESMLKPELVAALKKASKK